MNNNFSNLLAELSHVVWEFADHWDQELAKRWNQKLHVLAPVFFVLQNWAHQHLEDFVVLTCTCNEQSIDLEGIPHQFNFIVLNNEVQALTQVLLQLHHLSRIAAHEFQWKSSCLEQNVNIVRTLVVFILGSVMNEFLEHLRQLLAKLFNFSF